MYTTRKEAVLEISGKYETPIKKGYAPTGSMRSLGGGEFMHEFKKVLTPNYKTLVEDIITAKNDEDCPFEISVILDSMGLNKKHRFISIGYGGYHVFTDFNVSESMIRDGIDKMLSKYGVGSSHTSKHERFSKFDFPFSLRGNKLSSIVGKERTASNNVSFKISKR
jgi:hypothetical protein